MKDKLNEALECVSDQHITEAVAAKNRRRYQIPAVIAAVLALALVTAALVQPLISGKPSNVTLSNQLLVAEPQYPQLTQHPSISGKTGAWKSDYQALHDQPEGYADSLDPYFATITETLLSGTEGILTLPAGLKQIDSEAFAGLSGVDRVIVPESVTSIAADAFKGSQVILTVSYGSYAWSWAKENGYPYVYG